MTAPKSLRAVLQCAVDTATDQRREVPEVPTGWLAAAKLALDSNDEPAMLAGATTIAKAHSQYRAEFDLKGWLYDLRQTLYPRLRD